MTTIKQPIENVAWHALSAEDAAGQMGVDLDQGLDADDVQRRLAEYGPNVLPTEPPRVWVVARGQLSNPMNIMRKVNAQVADRNDVLLVLFLSHQSAPPRTVTFWLYPVCDVS